MDAMDGVQLTFTHRLVVAWDSISAQAQFQEQAGAGWLSWIETGLDVFPFKLSCNTPLQT
jgi:hypothetical protein